MSVDKLLKFKRSAGFTIAEILVSAAILMVVCLGISQLLVSSSKGQNRSDLYVIRQALEKYMTSMAQSQNARCNSIHAGGHAWACIAQCQACEAGSPTCTSSAGNCRNAAVCGGTDGGTYSVLTPQIIGLKDFQSILDNRTGGDNLAGLSIVTMTSGGNKVTDAGVPCGGIYQAATTQCRWLVTSLFEPDYNDAMRYTFTITYQANEADDTQKIPFRTWSVVIPMDDTCTSL